MPSTARKRIRRYLARATKDYPHLPEISRFPGTEISLTVPDLQELLSSEREARRVARRVIHEKLELQRKLREQGDAASRLRAENIDLCNNVAELSRKISDPPGSHERWQALRAGNASLAAQRDSLQTSLAQAETQIRTQAGTIEQQDRRMREIAAALSRAYTHNPVQQELERAQADAQEQRERADRAETEVDRQAGLLRGAHKDAERLERLAASVPDLRRLVEERGRKNRELTAERDRAVRQRDAAIAGTTAGWDYHALWEAETKARARALQEAQACTVERDRLQEALDNLRESVRKVQL